MISSDRTIHCINPHCNQPINNIGDRNCQNCQTPLIYRYLWAMGANIANIPPGTKVGERYNIITQQIWLDTQPGKPPEIPSELPPAVIPYLKLYPEKLHIPQPYGFTTSITENTNNILLLENAAIDSEGNLYPMITQVWEEATAVRQLYWLWQILQLWKPLSEVGVAASLLLPNNIVVQGWCIKLLELYPTTEKLTLQHLGESWHSWILVAKAQIAPGLKNIIQQMREGKAEFTTISHQLNELLLASVAETPFMVEVAGFTDTGLVMKHNEDSCYPCNSNDFDNYLSQHLAIICDGIGGHEGGEVASQLALHSLKLQIRAWLKDVAEQKEIIPPDLLQEQLAASLRVVNNMISTRNDDQNRQGRERMATTLVMSIQLPQHITTNTGSKSENSHEIYIASVGDSRAYWITPHYCQLLTIDHDMASRQVSLAQSLYRQAITAPNAHTLTQALGIKESQFLHFYIKRFILEEDGILLLCSDGLSDHDWVEKSWQNYVIPLLTGELAVEDAARNWVTLANENNGQDNTSIVITVVRTSQTYLVPLQSELIVSESNQPEKSVITTIKTEPSELQAPILDSLTESSEASLDLDIDTESAATPVKQLNHSKFIFVLGGFLALLLGGTSLGLFAWWQFQPQSFGRFCQQLPQELKQFCPQDQ